VVRGEAKRVKVLVYGHDAGEGVVVAEAGKAGLYELSGN